MQTSHPAVHATDGVEIAASFSLVRGDWLYRLQRRIGLIPEHGTGIIRRALFFSMLTWLPLAIWALLNDRMIGSDGEYLLAHYSLHVRCLVGIPLLIGAEAIAHQVVPLCLTQLVRNGLIDAELAPRFQAIIASGARLRDRAYPWIIIGGLVAAWAIAVSVSPNPDEVRWGDMGGASGFAIWWFLLVARPIFNVLLLAWLWRLVLATVLLMRIASLPLRIVPTHPDHVGGLGFLSRIPFIFAPFSFAVSAVMASAWGHEVVYHGVALPSLHFQMGTLVLVLTVLVMIPMLTFTPLLANTRRQALLDYGALLAEHGRKVDRRWIHGEPGDPDDPLLDAPELGPVADIHAIYEAVAAMRGVLVNKLVLLSGVVPAALPMLVLAGSQLPLKATLGKLLMTLL
ncbi:hypothetical protein [Cupriavidus pauculus]|uniref:hypothetical protein n=1 Tax=Cupriavidus pauculus TaxID=82633 RepID=UPI001EE2114F|nr:hypothetical protein [Cupriavidus pauculus]GJG97586.1 hypothetical protein CBA19C6_23875 [Cupriavidus pauculus]